LMQDATTYAVDGIPASRGAEWIHHWLGQRNAGRAAHLEAGIAPPAAAVAVYGNHGRWVVDCPDCGGAQLACRTDRRFMCNECGNVVIERLWRPVIWPADVAAIDVALADRPIRNQNWRPGETVDDLLAEVPIQGGVI